GRLGYRQIGGAAHRRRAAVDGAGRHCRRLTVVLSGDGRLLELLRQEHLVPLGTRIRTRLVTEAASREELLELLSHALSKAGNAALMTAELMDTLVDHSAGNYRLLMTM